MIQRKKLLGNHKLKKVDGYKFCIELDADLILLPFERVHNLTAYRKKNYLALFNVNDSKYEDAYYISSLTDLYEPSENKEKYKIEFKKRFFHMTIDYENQSCGIVTGKKYKSV